MVLDGLKKVFNKLGGITIDSSQKVGGGVQKVSGGVQKVSDGVTSPVKKIGDVSPSRIRPKIGKKPKKELKAFEPSKSSGKTIRKMRMDKDEIEIFKDLIDKRYERKEDTKEETTQSTAVQKASLEELLKEEEKPGLDVRLVVIMGVIGAVAIFTVVYALGFGIEIAAVFAVLILLMVLLVVLLPRMKTGGKSTAASREIPFALRQMATELRAGIGLHDSMRSVAMSGYGPLSEEFARALEEIKYGETTEKALVDMSDRIGSEGLTRAINQITRTLSSGGDLAKTLNVIADDTAYEMRMKLKDYAQKLNSFTMIYMFVAILGPVILMIMLIAATTVAGPIMPPIILIILYIFFFPAVVAFMAFMIKRLEPKV